MPQFESRETWVALDMAGCPNRCRHCWLEPNPNKLLSEEDLRWVVDLFRNWIRIGDKSPYFERVDALSWFREPDFHPDYRRLYDLERELNGHPPIRSVNLSIWRLAREKDYAKWARNTGMRDCQIAFFGTQKTNDWFHRREGAFRERIVATERLLEVGIRPRWKLFFTKPIVPELPELLDLIKQMSLHERTEELGGEFHVWLTLPDPDGEAWSIEHLRPTIKDLEEVPTELKESSYRFNRRPIGEAESILVSRMLKEEPSFPSAVGYPQKLGFYITSGFDVFSNIGEHTQWWKLGNLKKDSLDSIVDKLVNNKVPGLHVIYNVPATEMAKRFGRRNSQIIYSPEGLRIRWANMWARTLKTK